MPHGKEVPDGWFSGGDDGTPPLGHIHRRGRWGYQVQQMARGGDQRSIIPPHRLPEPPTHPSLTVSPSRTRVRACVPFPDYPFVDVEIIP